MIKYLSGDLSPEETRAFERELKGNPQLEEEFSNVSLAYRIIGDQIKSADEKAFNDALRAAMKKTDSRKSLPETRRLKDRLFRLPFLLTTVAASLAVLFSIFISQRGQEKIYTAWFNPSNDPVITALNGDMRGEAGHQTIVELWKKGEFASCRTEAWKLLSRDEPDPYVLLFFLLSSMETGQGPEALESLEKYQPDTGQTLGQSITWYKALALLRSGELQEANALLLVLGELSGPYQEDAHKLKKKLKK